MFSTNKRRCVVWCLVAVAVACWTLPIGYHVVHSYFGGLRLADIFTVACQPPDHGYTMRLLEQEKGLAGRSVALVEEYAIASPAPARVKAEVLVGEGASSTTFTAEWPTRSRLWGLVDVARVRVEVSRNRLKIIDCLASGAEAVRLQCPLPADCRKPAVRIRRGPPVEQSYWAFGAGAYLFEIIHSTLPRSDCDRERTGLGASGSAGRGGNGACIGPLFEGDYARELRAEGVDAFCVVSLALLRSGEVAAREPQRPLRAIVIPANDPKEFRKHLQQLSQQPP